MFVETLMHFLLLGSKNWSENKSDLKNCESFHYEAVRRAPGIIMESEKGEKITNKMAIKKCSDINHLVIFLEEEILYCWEEKCTSRKTNMHSHYSL